MMISTIRVLPMQLCVGILDLVQGYIIAYTSRYIFSFCLVVLSIEWTKEKKIICRMVIIIVIIDDEREH
jgi:hypothetical protein